MKYIFIINPIAGRGKYKKILPNIEKICNERKIDYEIKYISKEKDGAQIASEYKNLKVLYGVDAHFKYQIMNCEKAVEIANKHIGQDIIDKLHFCNERLEIE